MKKKAIAKKKRGKPQNIVNDAEIQLFVRMFSERMVHMRERRGYTQQQLADKLGWHRITISRLENGHHQPYWGQACQIADALGVQLEKMRTPLD